MNEDYLWSKSGEPDPEIAELERRLGRLSFKTAAQPLALPPEAPVGRHRSRFSRVLAVAAALIILLLAGGLWLGLRGSIFNDGKIPEVFASGPRPPIGPINPTTSAVKPEVHQPADSTSTTVQPAKFHNRALAERRRDMIAIRTNLNQARARRAQQLARAGEAAKAQLIRALSITSDALNTVQRKIQGEPEERRPIS